MTEETKQTDEAALKEVVALLGLSAKYSMLYKQVCEQICVDEESETAKKIQEIVTEAAKKEYKLMDETRNKIKELVAKVAN